MDRLKPLVQDLFWGTILAAVLGPLVLAALHLVD